MKLFVAMPYGPGTGYLDPAAPTTERTIEFDEVWNDVIRRAIPPDWEAKRAAQRSDGSSEPDQLAFYGRRCTFEFVWWQSR